MNEVLTATRNKATHTRWRIRFDQFNFQIVTPWFYFWASNRGYDMMHDLIWSGIEIGWKTDWTVCGFQPVFTKTKRWSFERNRPR